MIEVGGVDGADQIASAARVNAARNSRINWLLSSQPTETRMNPSSIPSFSRSAEESARWDDDAGWESVVPTSPSVGANGIGLAARKNAFAMARPPASLMLSMFLGSHLDSVAEGGNYDGLAGVVAGVLALRTSSALGYRAPLRLAGLRGEESIWYGQAYLGSKYACGQLSLESLAILPMLNTDRTLGDNLDRLGYPMAGAPLRVSRRNTRAYLELHIEQGPLLVEQGHPLAIPTAIRGNRRYPAIVCTGRSAHASAEPIASRRDAVLAACELISRFEAGWLRRAAAGAPDTQFTVGRIHTNPSNDGQTVVPGECTFSFNFGGTSQHFIDECLDELDRLRVDVERRRNVTIELGPCHGADPTPLDPRLRSDLLETANGYGHAPPKMATVSHDAAVFSGVGIPAAMVLIRNEHGSHNPEEAMDLDDFLDGVAVLAATAIRVGTS